MLSSRGGFVIIGARGPSKIPTSRRCPGGQQEGRQQGQALPGSHNEHELGNYKERTRLRGEPRETAAAAGVLLERWENSRPAQAIEE